MKRSEINRLMKEALAFIDQMGFRLPPFVFWSPQDWADKGPEYDELRDNMLGWDITDFGSGEFRREGLLLITLRNGNLFRPAYTKPYAEKLLIAGEEQVTPYHYHPNKMEDIINRGGGNLICRLYNCAPDGQEFDSSDVTVSSDGRNFTMPAGSEIRLTPGQSITLLPGQYHSFWGEKGSGAVLLGEVSKVNDDTVDNHFYRPTGRFPAIEEDEPPLHLLVTDYPASPTVKSAD